MYLIDTVTRRCVLPDASILHTESLTRLGAAGMMWDFLVYPSWASTQKPGSCWMLHTRKHHADLLRLWFTHDLNIWKNYKPHTGVHTSMSDYEHRAPRLPRDSHTNEDSLLLRQISKLSTAATIWQAMSKTKLTIEILIPSNTTSSKALVVKAVMQYQDTWSYQFCQSLFSIKVSKSALSFGTKM